MAKQRCIDPPAAEGSASVQEVARGQQATEGLRTGSRFGLRKTKSKSDETRKKIQRDTLEASNLHDSALRN
jgi:hypothetical protein